MKFAAKLRLLREDRKLTQVELANIIGVSARTYQYYEAGRMYPKDATTYQNIAKYFNVTIDELLNEQDMFLIEAQQKYGSRGRVQAERILEATEALYAGGALSDEDEGAFYRQMSRIFDKAKQRNAGRYAASHSRTDADANSEKNNEG